MKAQDLEKFLGLSFKQKSLLEQALTHSSYAHLHHLPDNERLEFLGDAVLSAIAAEVLYKEYPELPEGKLTAIRSQCVQGSSLAEAARQMGLQDHLRHAIASPSPKSLDNLLEQAFESLVGALFLELGYEKTKKKVLSWLQIRPQEGIAFNSKGLLQERLQPRIPVEAIEYRLKSAVGPDHARIFTVELYIQGKLAATSSAASKKKAEELAAQKALKAL
jgi:ribonuclease-3